MTVSRDDIEAKARQIVGTVEETKESVQDKAMLAGVSVVGAVLAAFFLGRRKGKKNKSVVEVYKV
ncbi:MAG: hypothetical protein WDZ96_05830 [Acidimicrobiia bacterium]